MNKKITRTKIVISVIILLAIGWFGWSKLFSSTTATPTYKTATIEKGTLVVSVASSGQVTTANSRAADTQVTGVVKQVFIKDGQTVTTGSKLVELELDQAAQQKYTQALASYQSAKNSLAAAQSNLYSTQSTLFSTWDSFKTLAESDTYKDTSSSTRSLPEFHISQNNWLAAEATYKNQQSVVAAAQTTLSSAAQLLRQSSAVVTAPISGVVSGFSLQKGSVLGSDTTTVAKILTTAVPSLTVNLTEIDVPKIALENKVSISIDALPDKKYTGKVVSIDKTGVVSSGVTSYPAVILFDTAAPEVFANMSAQVSIITATKSDVLLVPASAVKTQNGQASVQILKGTKPETVSVTTGLASDTTIEILSGLAEGDTVITSTTTATATKTATQTTSPFSGIGGGMRTR